MYTICTFQFIKYKLFLTPKDKRKRGKIRWMKSNRDPRSDLNQKHEGKGALFCRLLGWQEITESLSWDDAPELKRIIQECRASFCTCCLLLGTLETIIYSHIFSIPRSWLAASCCSKVTQANFFHGTCTLFRIYFYVCTWPAHNLRLQDWFSFKKRVRKKHYTEMQILNNSQSLHQF